ncbi:MAG TPA: hypothetical protein ENK53_06870 [Thiotrichales bacterium]|nr:hypothetical protein [Thiotrichales bacterium]
MVSSLAKLAALAGVSKSTAHRWSCRGLLVRTPSGGIDVAATLAKVEAARDRGAMLTHDPDIPNLARLKARVLEERARLLEIERRRKEQELVPAEEVERWLAAMIIAFRTKVLSISQRLRQRFPELPMALFEHVDHLHREALEELKDPELVRAELVTDA